MNFVHVCFTKWLLLISYLPSEALEYLDLLGGFFFPPLWKGLRSIVLKCLTKKERKKERLGFTSQLHGFQGAEATLSLSLSLSLSATFVFA
jgi:hypothetical protein